MGYINFACNSRHLVLVILTIFAISELTESCHRRVEYHYKVKRPPPPHHHPHHHHKGHGHGHGHYGGGHHVSHHGGHPHGGHGGGHGGGFHNFHGHRHHHPVRGHHGHHHPRPHGPPTHHGHGHRGHPHHEHHGVHLINGFPGHHGGHGGHGGSDFGHGHGGHFQPSHGVGDHPQQNSGVKGHKFKYQSFESMRYNEPNHQQPHHDVHNNLNQNEYEDATPVYKQKGYGHSGPYPDVEYTSPALMSSLPNPQMDHPGLNSFTIYDSPPNDFRDPQSHLDAADTADLIRQGQGRRQKQRPFISDNTMNLERLAEMYADAELIRAPQHFPQPSPTAQAHTSLVSGPGFGLHHSDIQPHPHASEMPSLQPQMTSGIPDGNFDLNLNYNSELPGPFRRNLLNPDGTKRRRRRRKKISSKYRGGRLRPNPVQTKKPVVISHHRDYANNNLDTQASQNYHQHIVMKGGSDYLENDFMIDPDLQMTTTRRTQDPRHEFINF